MRVPVTRLALVPVIALLVGAFLYVRADRGRADASGASAEAVLACVQAAGLAASFDVSSTGTQQISIAHGPGAIGSNTTLADSQTSIAYLPSADEASFFGQELRGSSAVTGISPDLVSQHDNAVVVIGMTATQPERAAIARCLAEPGSRL